MRTLLAIRCVLVASAASTLLAQSDTAKAPTTGFAHADEVRYVAFDSSGKWLVSMDESVVKTWRLPEGKRVTQAVVEGGASVVRISPTEPLVAILRKDYAVELRTLPGLQLVRSWKTNQSTSCLAFSHDGSNVATCEIGSVRFWDTATGTQVRQIESKEEQFESKEVFNNLAFSPDGKWLATSGRHDFWSGNPRVSLWQLSDLTRVRTMGSHPEGAYYTLSFTPDSNYLVAGSNNDQWSLWGVPSGKPAAIRDGPNGYWTVTPGTDGATLLSADGGRVQVWNLPGGTQRLAFEGHQGQVRSIAPSPDGATFATAGKDRAIRVWKLADGSLVQQLVDQTSAAKTTTTEAKGAAAAAGSKSTANTAPRVTVLQGAGPQSERGVVIDRQQRFPCKGMLVAGNMFEPEPGKALFELKGKLVGSTGTPLAGEVMSIWPLPADGIFGFRFEVNGNPEVKTDAKGAFGLKMPAMIEDFRVVVGLPAKVEGEVCGIIPVRKDGEVWKIRLTGASAVIDLGTITAK
jgi:hypothetical protein